MAEEKKKTERLGFFLSFKKSEEELLKNIKNIKNYSAVIKELMSLYIENDCKMPTFKESKQQNTSNTLTVTFDDICKLVASVNSAPANTDSQSNDIIKNNIQGDTQKHSKADEGSYKDAQNEELDEDELDVF